MQAVWFCGTNHHQRSSLSQYYPCDEWQYLLWSLLSGVESSRLSGCCTGCLVGPWAKVVYPMRCSHPLSVLWRTCQDGQLCYGLITLHDQTCFIQCITSHHIICMTLPMRSLSQMAAAACWGPLPQAKLLLPWKHTIVSFCAVSNISVLIGGHPWIWERLMHTDFQLLFVTPIPPLFETVLLP